MEGNIKMDLREVGCDPRDWKSLAEDRAYVRAVMNLRVLESPLVSQVVNVLLFYSLDHGCANHATEGETLVPYPLL